MDLAVIRPATLRDLEVLIDFSEKAGIGITSLPQNPQLLESKLKSVEESFSTIIISPKHESYLFCLEWKNKVIGISGIISRIGMTEPFFSYHLLPEKVTSPYLGIEKEFKVLHFLEARKKPTEIGTLFVLPEFRDKTLGFGKLLSFSRFLFIANFRFRFASVIIAELRGVNENGHSPFWDAVGRHFFEMDFAKADFLRTAHPQIIEEVFPKHPLYVDLLPVEARETIGKVHSATLPALTLLEKQGFKYSGYYDIFDAGPHVFAATEHVHSIQTSKIGVVKKISEEVLFESQAFLSNTLLNFRACFAPFEKREEEVILHPDVAEALSLSVGDPIRYYEGAK